MRSKSKQGPLGVIKNSRIIYHTGYFVVAVDIAANTVLIFAPDTARISE
jgi:hypothetical protein